MFIFADKTNNIYEMHPKNRSFIKKQTSNTESDNEWQQVQRMKTFGTTSSDIKAYNERQHVTTNDSKRQQMRMSDDEWQRVTTGDYEYQRVTTSGHFD